VRYISGTKQGEMVKSNMFSKLREYLQSDAGDSQNASSDRVTTRPPKAESRETSKGHVSLTQKPNASPENEHSVSKEPVDAVDPYNTWIDYALPDELGRRNQKVRVKLLQRENRPSFIEGQFTSPQNQDALDDFDSEKLRENGLLEDAETKRRRAMIKILEQNMRDQGIEGKPIRLIENTETVGNRHDDLVARQEWIDEAEKQYEERNEGMSTSSVLNATDLVPKTERKLIAANSLNKTKKVVDKIEMHHQIGADGKLIDVPVIKKVVVEVD
jgi:hypothetical protein